LDWAAELQLVPILSISNKPITGDSHPPQSKNGASLQLPVGMPGP